ncbi:MAG TPA: hypothetical protein VHC86_12560 [Opitutaceae bacterium]|nr:hypothetical protein [Opitutaceae bacterium]
MSAPARARYRFVAETRGDPLGAFPALAVGSEPLNLWLSRALLEPALQAWSGLDPAEPGAAEAVAAAFARASRLGRARFQELLPAAAAAGDAALLAAVGVTANLQRTLAALGELLLAGGRIGPAAAGEPAELPLSRCWSGLLEYPPGAPLFAARAQPPRDAATLDYRRREIRHLSNALWCAPGTVRLRCRQAIEVLGHEIRRSGLFRPDDLRHLRGHGVAGRPPPATGHSPVAETGRARA